jgi:YD repeat-containing protein
VTTTRTTSHNPGTGDTTVTTNNFDTSSETTTAYLSGQIKTSTRTGYATTEYLYSPFTQTQKSGELTTSQTVDLLGRTISDTTPQNGTTLTTYHPHNAPAGARGKTATVTDADGVTTSYGYNNEGELTSTSRLIPLPNGASATQVTQTNNDVVANVTIHGTALGVSLRTTQTISSSATTTASGAIPPAPMSPITTSASYRSINGLLRGSVSFGRQTLTISTRPNQNGIATTTTIAPDGTKTQQITTHGLQTLSLIHI